MSWDSLCMYKLYIYKRAAATERKNSIFLCVTVEDLHFK